ncbi:MAG TPA: glycosyltransferase [Ramlibacter sp.]|jgi:GT2 family glycosyltransferase|nr:glycosyltransferase [Ramlibacter sp.]
MRTAFIVLTYNRPDALLQVLAALARQCGPAHEVLIADDGSRPEHVQALRDRLPAFRCRVRHVWHPDTGFTIARARNAAAARTDADYLVFIDGDSVPNPRFVAQHEALAQAGQFVIGKRVLLEEKLTQDVVQGRVDLQSLGAADWIRLRLAGQANKLTHLLSVRPRGHVVRDFRWRGIRGANMAFWRGDFARVNGFDEAFAGWGHEDADIVLRLHNSGTVRCNALLGTEVYHLWHRQNSRADEADNRRRVQDRLSGGMIRAERGLDVALHTTGTVVTELNR